MANMGGMTNGKSWSVLCWALVLLWLVPSLCLNVPATVLLLFKQPSPEDLSMTGNITFGGSVYPVGWPTSYGKVHRIPNAADRFSFSVGLLFLNLVIVVVTLCCLIYFVQTAFPETRIIHLIALTAAVGLLIAIGQHVFTNPRPIIKKLTFALVVYFCPILLAAITYCLGMYKRDTEIKF